MLKRKMLLTAMLHQAQHDKADEANEIASSFCCNDYNTGMGF
jgi:hypothetical protein